MPIINQSPDESVCVTKNSGIITCIQQINKECVRKLNSEVDEYDIQQVMLNGADNLPDQYEHKQKVIDWEKQYYARPTENGLFRAPIDTTFALYRPHVGLSRSRSVEAYRTAYPYQAEHKPWYNDSKNLSEEESYYISHCSQITGWTSQSQKKEDQSS